MVVRVTASFLKNTSVKMQSPGVRGRDGYNYRKLRRVGHEVPGRRTEKNELKSHWGDDGGVLVDVVRAKRF